MQNISSERYQIIRSNTLLFFAAAAWGATFVVQRTAMDVMGPFTYSGLRFLLGSLVLLPLAIRRYRKKSSNLALKSQTDWRLTILGSLLAGSLICIGINLQQFGLIDTTAGKAGFITGLYVIFVPIIGLLIGQKIKFGVWVGAPLAVAGLYLLSVTGGFTLAPGDGFILACAFVWAIQVLSVGWLSPKIDSIMLAFGQSFVCAILSLVLALIFEDIQLAAITEAWFDILFGGIVSVGIGFTMQISGQKHSPPTHAAIIMQFEAVFAAFSGWLILGETLSGRAFAGAGLMLAGMLIAQVLPSWQTLKSMIRSS